MPHIVSQEQNSLIHGRNIRDYILLTSKVANLLNKTYGGNITMKVDISGEFETLN